MRIGNLKDFLAGLLFTAFSALLAYNALLLPLGTSRSMGPGYFPFSLAAILGVLGLITIARSIRAGGEPLTRIPLRGVFFITLAIVIFALVVRPWGFVPAVAITVAISTLASSELRPLPALGVVVFLVVFCWAVFIKGLGMPVPLFG